MAAGLGATRTGSIFGGAGLRGVLGRATGFTTACTTDFGRRTAGLALGIGGPVYLFTPASMSVLTPSFLWALAAVSIPLWLHLSRKRQYKEMSLGTLRFLQEVLQERKKRSRFEEWPLLLLRILAVALLALTYSLSFQDF